ncbi:P-loop NTPase [Gordonia sputi]
MTTDDAGRAQNKGIVQDLPSDQALAHLQSQAVATEFTLIRSLGGGKSGAQVLLVDARGTQLDGQYVAKVQRVHSRGENANTALRALGTYTNEHTPEIVLEGRDGDWSIEVYDIAGFSMDTTKVLREVSNQGDRSAVLGELCAGLLSAQLNNEARRTVYKITAVQMLELWLGDRFWAQPRYATIDEYSSIEVSAQRQVIRLGAEILPNPLPVIQEIILDDARRCGALAGLNHGDLHSANIITQGTLLRKNLNHWIIDANWSEQSPLLYDFAYLEISLVLDHLAIDGPIELIVLLEELTSIENHAPEKRRFSGSDEYHDLLESLAGIRSEVRDVLSDLQARRIDVWSQQILLARVGAGLNWASKPVKAEWRTTALIYAAWAMREWLREFRNEEWQELALGTSLEDYNQLGTLQPEPATDDVLRSFWKKLISAPIDTDIIILSGRIRGLGAEVQLLATVRPALIVDLDPDSDTEGLYASLNAFLASRTRISQFGFNESLTDPATTTNWLMANGWTTRSEDIAPDLKTWRRNGYVARVRKSIDFIANYSQSRSVIVIAIRDDTTRPMALRVLEYLDEAYSGAVSQMDLTSVGDAKDSLARFLSINSVGVVSDTPGPSVSVPGANGRVSIGVQTLQRMESDLEVLHDQILTLQVHEEASVDEFWRGRPPTWYEVASGVDVHRDIQDSTLQTIRRMAMDARSTILRIDHSPGAGATTFIRRLAWELMNKSPVVLLKRVSNTTGELISELSTLTGAPVIVFAESAVATETDRDAVFDGVQRNNGRAIVVWANRTTSPSDKSVKLIDPMSAGESSRFVDILKGRIDSPDRGAQLQNLVDEYASHPRQYHSPFFYGMTAFERSFTNIGSFVSSHINEFGPLQVKISQYLALVTRYSQAGVYPTLVRKWIGDTGTGPHVLSDDYLTGLLGSPLRHLVVTDGHSLRIMHPLIAEQLIGHYQRNYGFLNLAQISMNLIDDVFEVLGVGSKPAVSLLISIFIARSGEFNRDRFSELVSGFTPEEGQLVFERLTERYPREANFWNHRGRFHIYRVRGDYATAEGFLEKAVEVSPPGSRGTHLHTLGMVGRLWVENQVESLARSSGTVSASIILETVRANYEAAMEAFRESRSLNSGSNHSWVTPIQLANTVIESMISSSGGTNLHEFLEREDELAEWVSLQMHHSEELLDAIGAESVERPARDNQRDFYAELSTEIDALYGDIDVLIEQWKALKSTGDAGDARLGGSMARAVFAACRRSWADVEEERSRELQDMLQPAVDSGIASDGDLRVWLQASRRLPEYSRAKALERASFYATERKSLDGAYYAYVLCFQLWARGELVDQNRIREYLDLCKRISGRFRQDWSYEWLSEGGLGEIVHFSELGRWTRDRKRVWSESGRLGRVRGVIDEVEGYKSGFVRVGNGSLQAFFQPQGDILKSRDLNKVAEFYLGFSYGGLRAWALETTIDEPDASRSLPNLLYSRANDTTPHGVRRSERRADGFGVRDAGSKLASPRPAEMKLAEPVLGEVDLTVRELVRSTCANSPGEELLISMSALGELIIGDIGQDRYRDFKATSKTLHAGLVRLGFTVSASGSGYKITYDR